MTFNVRYVHKISPKDTDTMGPITISNEALLNRVNLGAALRKARVISRGDRIREFRIEKGGRVVAFPSKSIWHCIILTVA